MTVNWKWVVGIGGTLIVVALVASWVGAGADRDTDLATAVVKRGPLLQVVQAVGRVRPSELVAVGAQVSGQVQRLHVRLGQAVEQGQLIAEVDAQPQRLALRNAHAAVAALDAQLAGRRVALEQAKTSLTRQRTLAALDATAGVNLEAAKAAEGILQAEVRALHAQIEQARTQVDTALTQLRYTRIVAPMEGVVVAVVTKQGQTLNAFQSTPTIVMLARLDVMTVRAEISEADVNLVAPGMAASFLVPGSRTERYEAPIAQIEPAPESIVGDAAAGAQPAAAAAKAVYYNALFDVPNLEGRLRPSMTVQVSVQVAAIADALLVPSAAVRAEKEGRLLARVLQPDGQVVDRTLRLGLRTPLQAQVLGGLAVGERVVVGEAEVGNTAVAISPSAW